MWNSGITNSLYKIVDSPLTFNMKLFVIAIAPSIRPLLTKLQGGLACLNLPQ